MATNFPTGLDVLANPTSTDNFDTAGVLHDQQHTNANDAIEALQAKLGIDFSLVANTLDYRIKRLTEAMTVACGDETTPLTTGTKIKFQTPHPLECFYLIAYVNTAPTGSTLIVDIKINGTSMLSTLLSIDAGEKTSGTAAVPFVINTGIATWGGGEELAISITQVGSTVAGAGLKVNIYTRRIP